MISHDTIELILDRADIIDVVKEYVPNLTIKGVKALCSCPFHKDKSPSLSIDGNKGLYHCFSCGRSGNVIQFVMEAEHIDFVESAKKLAKRYHIDISDEAETSEQREKRLKVEAMRSINELAATIYEAYLWSATSEAKEALQYIQGRKFKDDFIKASHWGYAPQGNVLLKAARAKGINLDVMVEMGLLGKTERGDYYDCYQNRWIIPVYSRSNQIIAFTCRILPGYETRVNKDGSTTKVGKYVNSKNSDCYDKSKSLFGINEATVKAVKDGKFYLVEGAPDAMRLHSIGATNTIATLGTAWTKEHFEQLRKYNAKLCFIPDCDELKPGELFGTGVQKVLKNGRLAMEMGFQVSVKEIPEGENGGKEDPDSFFTSLAILDSIEERDFVLWYFAKYNRDLHEPSAQSALMGDVATLIALIPDRINIDSTVNILCKHLGTKKQWNDAIKAAKKDHVEAVKKRSQNIDRDLLLKYGFCQDDNNSYYSIGDGGKEYQWSNFIMTPLFHIEDAINPKRLFRIKNVAGADKIIELKQSDLTSLAKFSERVEGMGNFIWLAKAEQLNRLKMFLYEQTETATEIAQLGWQTKGFWAFGNGAIHNGEWISADEYGIVRLPNIGNFYLPSASMIYKHDNKMFQFERRFVHNNLSQISLRGYTDKMVEVFGNNAKVGFCFLLATLFKDVVTSITKNFPLLNLFGQKGSGKSEMGHTLMSFFIIENTPPNLQFATDAGLAETVAQCANALVHLDEYKNSIDLNRREFLKGLYDGTGRTRLNMDRDKKRETTAVDCGVIVSGQEMPTIDNALFSRLLYLTFNYTEFSTEAKAKFDELKEMRKLGCTHLTIEIIAHRKKFEIEFPANYRAALSDIVLALEHESIDDRILRSWTIPLAAFRTLGGVLDLSWDYKEMMQICINGIVRQNAETRSNNELAQMWTAIDIMHQQGLILTGQDFRIEYERKLKCIRNGKGINVEWTEPRPILYLNYELVLSSYQKFARGQGDTIVPTNTLKNYLEVSKEYFGKKTSCRFLLINNAFEGSRSIEDKEGRRMTERTSKPSQAYCFDYASIAEHYGINLEISSTTDTADEKDVSTEQKDLPF